VLKKGEEIEESETEFDEDEEYHDADDEGSDGICEEETTMEWISKPDKTESEVDKALEFEFVEVNGQQRGAIKKRCVFMCVWL